ncbi:ATP-binding protein [Paenibacillus elgii]
MSKTNREVEQVSMSAFVSETAPMEGLFLIRPQNMFESLRNAEYDMESGLSEIVDNGVEAGASNIWIYTKSEKRKIGTSSKETEVLSEIVVIDNGTGMSPEVQNRSLVLGDTFRPAKPDGSRGIGKFGVGLTLGGISLARRIEIYTRDVKSNAFTFTYLDLNEIKKEKQKSVPTPIFSKPPAEYANKLEGSTGTIVILKDCDRLMIDPVKGKAIQASEQIAGLAYYLGRTYRKFIYGGLNIDLNGEKVYLHDPLFRLGPTRFDMKNPQPDLKATLWGKTESIPLEIPRSGGKTANIQITMTLLPKEWRKERGDGNRAFAVERKIPDNEGISILRANREVLYDAVPYIIGTRGQAKFLDIDRWWSCEISFPPELDEYFTVRYIKRGAEPIKPLKEQIRGVIGPIVKDLRIQIQNDFNKEKEKKVQETNVFADAENAMSEADKTQPRGKRGSTVTQEDYQQQLDQIAEQTVGDKKAKEEKKKELEEKPYSIVAVNLPEMFFFETVHMLGKTVVKLNINHPFYKSVFEPLCGTIESMDEDSDVNDGTVTEEQRKIRQAFMLLLLSFAKAESFFEDSDQQKLINSVRNQWGIFLGNVISSVVEKG